MATCHACSRESAVAFRFCPECGAPAGPAAASRELRKVVTIVFCDVTGSTELDERLDPEALRTLLAPPDRRRRPRPRTPRRSSATSARATWPRRSASGARWNRC
jgi:hypothetical protein